MAWRGEDMSIRDAAWWRSWYPEHIPSGGDLLMVIGDLAAAESRAVEAEAKVAALTKLVAQSSTQYREMVAELDDYKAYYDTACSGDYEKLYAAVDRIEARREAESKLLEGER